MFRKKSDEVVHRRRHGVGPIRFLLSLIIMGVLAAGLYLAVKDFSGYDPLKLNLGSIEKSIFESDLIYKLVTNVLSYTPNGQFQAVKDKFNKSQDSKGQSTPTSQLKYRFAIVADPHKDAANLAKALKQAKEAEVKFVIGIGDFSDVGTLDELRNIKKEFDAVNLPYYTTAGDHDLWDARDKGKAARVNFVEVFGTPYRSFSEADTRFILVYNADTYEGLDGVQMKWLGDELARAKEMGAKTTFVITGIPLYHPSSDHVMGRVTPKLEEQAASLIDQFSKNNVNEVFFGDTHFFSQYSEPKTNLKMTVVGAVTSERNTQAPRFALVDIYEDGSYNIQDTEIK